MADEMSRRVLIIDDDEDLAQAISTRLGALGYDCAVAHNGEQGLAQFRRAGADLIITDVNMPELDGFSVAATLRASSAVPVILITGYASTPVLTNVSGITLVFKPLDWKRLADLVASRLTASAEAATE